MTPPPEWDGTYGTMPRTRKLFGPSVPDLSRIPEERWAEVLLPLTERERSDAVYNHLLGARIHRAVALRDALPSGFVASVGRDSLSEGTAIPAPTPARTPGSRQLNLRISPEQYARLEQAAAQLGEKPTVLARLLVVNGVNRIFADHARLALGLEEESA